MFRWCSCFSANLHIPSNGTAVMFTTYFSTKTTVWQASLIRCSTWIIWSTWTTKTILHSLYFTHFSSSFTEPVKEGHYPQCGSNADSLAEDLIFSVQLQTVRHLSDFTHLCTAFTAALPNTFDVSNQRRNCKLSFKPRKDLMFFILKKKQDIGRKTVDAPWPLYCICGSSQTNLQLIKMIWLIGELGSPQKPTSLVIQPF